MSDMTSAVAIELLDNLIGMIEDNQGSDYDTAFHMAMDALKTQADGDTISRQAAYDTLTGYYHHTTENQHKALREALERVPPAQPKKRTQERTETHACDLISRQDAIDAIEEMQMPIMRSTFPEEQFVFRGMSESLNAIKELTSAQPEIVRCKDCKYWNDEFAKDKSTCWLPCMSMTTHRKWYCGSAERRTDE